MDLPASDSFVEIGEVSPNPSNDNLWLEIPRLKTSLYTDFALFLLSSKLYEGKPLLSVCPLNSILIPGFLLSQSTSLDI